MTPGEETLAFLRSLFYDTPEPFWTMFWTRQDKGSHWSTVGVGPEALAGMVGDLADDNDVYVSVSVSQSDYGPKRRIEAKSAAGIMGLWADIDVAEDGVHKKWTLPPTVEDAQSVLDAVGLRPSIVIHSGHGLQAWWLFEEFWEFTDEDDRLRAAQLSEGWNTTLRVRASERGWSVDSTFDLARVMRIPGTTNFKGEPPMPVRLLEINEARYDREHFEEFMVDEVALARLGLTPASGYAVSDDLVLNERAEPPFTKFSALTANDPTFQKSWDHTRTPRDFPDQSQSSYDLSLASFAVVANWTDQEIADLIIANRRHHGKDLKLRLDYYRRTIAKAHESMDRNRSGERLDDAADEFVEAQRSGDDEAVREKRRGVLDVVSRQLGIEIIRVIKFNSQPPSYRLVMPTGGVTVGSASEMLNQNHLRASIVAETAHLIERFKQAEWDKLMKVIFSSAEEQDVGLESTESGQIYSWLSEYMMSRRPVDGLSQAEISGYPYIENGEVFIFTTSFKQFLWLSRGERVSPKDLGRQLRLFGCTPANVKVRDDAGNDTTKAVWKLPPREAWKA